MYAGRAGAHGLRAARRGAAVLGNGAGAEVHLGHAPARKREACVLPQRGACASPTGWRALRASASSFDDGSVPETVIQARGARNTRSPCSSMILRALLTDKVIAASRDVDVSARMKWAFLRLSVDDLADTPFGRPAAARLAGRCDDGEASYSTGSAGSDSRAPALLPEQILEKPEHRFVPRLDDAAIVVEYDGAARAYEPAGPPAVSAPANASRG